jgi:hypothetical protein
MRYWVCPRCDDLQPVGTDHCSTCGQVLDDDSLFERRPVAREVPAGPPMRLVAVAAFLVGMILLSFALDLD